MYAQPGCTLKAASVANTISPPSSAPPTIPLPVVDTSSACAEKGASIKVAKMSVPRNEVWMRMDPPLRRYHLGCPTRRECSHDHNTAPSSGLQMSSSIALLSNGRPRPPSCHGLAGPAFGALLQLWRAFLRRPALRPSPVPCCCFSAWAACDFGPEFPDSTCRPH